MGLGGVLGGTVVHRTTGSLEGHGAECTFVENLAVSFLDVTFQQGQSQVDDTTVDAPGQQRWECVRLRLDAGREGWHARREPPQGSSPSFQPIGCSLYTYILILCLLLSAQSECTRLLEPKIIPRREGKIILNAPRLAIL